MITYIIFGECNYKPFISKVIEQNPIYIFYKLCELSLTHFN